MISKQASLIGMDLSQVERITNISQGGQPIDMNVSDDGKELIIRARQINISGTPEQQLQELLHKGAISLNTDTAAPFNRYTQMQRHQYNDNNGTDNHENHNDNTDYWDVLLGDLKDKKRWDNKVALDFGCGKGRNVTNMIELCKWKRVDGIDLSHDNITFCTEQYKTLNSEWYVNNGVDGSDLKDEEYDFIMSTIVLQHIPVHDIRQSLITDLFRCLKSGGMFSFQMAYGPIEDKNYDQKIISPNNETVLDTRVRDYHSNYYDAPMTNSGCDVRIEKSSELITDLEKIGFINIETKILDSFSDTNHPKWIYVKAYKPDGK